MKLRKLKGLFSLVLTSLLVVSNTAVPTYAEGEDQSGTVCTTLQGPTMEAGKQFTFIGLPYNGKYSPIKEFKGYKLVPRTTQNFAYTPDGKYVFTTAEADSNNKRHTLLTRCSNPAVKGPQAEAFFQETCVLENYGHGETIEITQPDVNREVYNIWVATKPTGGFYGLQMARLTYEVNNGVGSITKCVRLTNFRKTNVKKGKACYFDKGATKKLMPERVNTSIDVANNQIAFRVGFNCNTSNYLIYDFNKINTVLDELPDGGSFNMKKAAKWQKANLRANLEPCRVYQCFYILDNTLYISGGNVDLGAMIYTYEYETTNNYKKVKQLKVRRADLDRIINIQPQVTIDEDTVLDIGELEIEGLKVYKDYATGRHDMYINFYQKDIPITSSIGVYKFSVEDTVQSQE